MLRQRQKSLVHRVLGVRRGVKLLPGQGQHAPGVGGVDVREEQALLRVLYGLDAKQQGVSPFPVRI